MKPLAVSDIQIKAIEHYFVVALFIVLCKMVQCFKCVDETLVYMYSLRAGSHLEAHAQAAKSELKSKAIRQGGVW